MSFNEHAIGIVSACVGIGSFLIYKIFGRYQYTFREDWGFRSYFTWWHCEFAFQFRCMGFSFHQTHERGTLSFHCPPISFYLSFPALRVEYRRGGDNIFEDQRGLSLYMSMGDGSMMGGWNFRWNLWTPHMSWSSKTPWYRNGSWYPLDTILGKVRHRVIRTVEENESVDVPMTEGVYPTKIRILEEGWKRKYWFYETKLKRCHADMWVPIPHMGKGENSWDCGEDGTYGLCCMAKDIPEAVAKIVESSLRDRKKYDGRHRWPAPPTREQYEKDMAKIRKQNEARHGPAQTKASGKNN
jgi:hypothetical protein